MVDLVDWVVVAGLMDRCMVRFHKHPAVSPRFCVEMSDAATQFLPVAPGDGRRDRAKDLFVVMAILCKVCWCGGGGGDGSPCVVFVLCW